MTTKPMLKTYNEMNAEQQMAYRMGYAAASPTITEGTTMTQKDRLLATLKLGPVCSFRFYDHVGLTHRIAARVWDLRQDGHIITSRPCRLHDHESNAVLYELAESDQLSLL